MMKHTTHSRPRLAGFQQRRVLPAYPGEELYQLHPCQITFMVNPLATHAKNLIWTVALDGNDVSLVGVFFLLRYTW